jgi:UDP-N-acetylglucosamine 2-epimerase (non-hydrolysing)
MLYGTRPEAIKMAPVAAALRARPDRFRLTVCAIAQHRQMLDQVHDQLGLAPDLDLDLMRPGQGLNELAGRAFLALDEVLGEARPDWVLVQGDTTSAAVAALAAFHRRLRVGHVEAGLRTGDLAQPFPEEANRRLVDLVADALFAPTERARRQLLAEGVPPGRIHLTGNTVVDALGQWWGNRPVERLPEVLITIHRRESFGRPLARVFAALRELARLFPDVRWVFPVHPNPQVRQPAHEQLSGLPNLELHEPFDYPELVGCLARCRLVLTDSGGIQEEAPAFGKPVLVLREKTERPEGVEAGVAQLVGTETERIVAAAVRLLTDESAYAAMSRVGNPYGDGRAAERIAHVLAGEAYTPFAAAMVAKAVQ